MLKILILILLLNACDQFSNENSNKVKNKELLPVIEHYSKSPKDSLKLEAAYFLIKNMKYQSAIVMDNTINNHENIIQFYIADSIIETLNTSDRIYTLRSMKNYL